LRFIFGKFSVEGKRHGSHKANNKLYPALFREMFRILKVDGEALLLTMEKGIMSRLLQQQRNKWQTIKIYNVSHSHSYFIFHFVLRTE
jgi:23S rRNA G2445 N2-methylase RlmL